MPCTGRVVPDSTAALGGEETGRGNAPAIRGWYACKWNARLDWQARPLLAIASLHFFCSELIIYASPVREWLDSEIDVGAMFADSASMNHLWLHELNPAAVPRQWLRGAFEFLQAWHKITDGTPDDSKLATHLVEVDHFISADKNFVRFAERCRAEAPFPTAIATRISGGREGVDEILRLI